MTDWERGFLLLTCPLGDPQRRPLTTAQFRELAKRVRAMPKPAEDRDLTLEDLLGLGYQREMAFHILQLLAQKEALHRYLWEAERCGCYAITRNTRQYPDKLRQLLGENAPATLWIKGDRSLLDTPMIALVGSRDLRPENRIFAERIGILAAQQGYTLVSGNARGADSTAQDACLAHGGRVIAVVADSLRKQWQRENVLYISLDGFNCGFSAARALMRNHVIHSLGKCVYVAQCGFGKGGTWRGTFVNLREKRTPVICYDDGGEASRELVRLGAATADNTIEKL